MDFLEIFESVKTFYRTQIYRKISPAEFRRGTHKQVRAIGSSPDRNSRHIGAFGDRVIPMKRRFKEVSRTAK